MKIPEKDKHQGEWRGPRPVPECCPGDRDRLARGDEKKLERGDRFKLVMVLGESAWRAKHIPGSLHFANPDAMLHALSPDDEIVVYCAGPSCMASAFAYWFLKSRGYRKVRCYAGGIEE